MDWARRVDGLVIEDDYYSEFSYDRPTPPVIQGTAKDRVALLGSMSTVLGPTVGIGWVVAPRRWVQAVRAEHEIQVLPPALNQSRWSSSCSPGPTTGTCAPRGSVSGPAAMTARRAGTAPARVPGARRGGGSSGTARAATGTDEGAILRAAARRGIELCDLYEVQLPPRPRDPGLLVGYGNIKDSVIDAAVAALAEVIRDAG